MLILGHGVALSALSPARVGRVGSHDDGVASGTLLLARDTGEHVVHLLMIPSDRNPGAAAESLPGRSASFAPRDLVPGAPSVAVVCRPTGVARLEHFGGLGVGPSRPGWALASDGVQFELPSGYYLESRTGSLDRHQLCCLDDPDGCAISFAGPFTREVGPPLLAFVSRHQRVVSIGEDPTCDGQPTWIDLHHEDARSAWWQRLCYAHVGGRDVLIDGRCRPPHRPHVLTAIRALITTMRPANSSASYSW